MSIPAYSLSEAGIHPPSLGTTSSPAVAWWPQRHPAAHASTPAYSALDYARDSKVPMAPPMLVNSHSFPTPKQQSQDTAVRPPPRVHDSTRAESTHLTRRPGRAPDWQAFYKNGPPKEIIVIDDDSPPPSVKSHSRSQNGHVSPQPPSKRRRAEISSQSNHNYDLPVSHHAKNGAAVIQQTSQSNGSAPNAGQKRKRQSRPTTPAHEVDPAHDVWGPFVPPPWPPFIAEGVSVPKMRDPFYAHVNVDDEEGHFNVVIDSMIGHRYRISRILGQGTFGKVVEALDLTNGTRVAVKVIRAVQKYRDASRIELRVLKTLAQNDRTNRFRCIHLRECFDFRNHICIVTDLLGQSVFDFLKSNSFVPFPSSQIQHFARQLLSSVAFLHSIDLVHTDLKPENILLVNNTYQTFTYGRWIPSSSTTVSRRAAQRRVLLDTDIRLIDFGSATFQREYHSSVVSTRHYRAPEIILSLGWSFACDMWSIACILVEFYTGDALFQTHDNLEHLALIEAVTGRKMPLELVRKLKYDPKHRNNSAADFFNRNGKLNYPDAETSKGSKKYVKAMKKLKDIIPPTTPFNVQFLDLIESLFTIDPESRMSAREALDHPWFRERVRDDGTEAVRLRQEREAERQNMKAAELVVLKDDDRSSKRPAMDASGQPLARGDTHTDHDEDDYDDEDEGDEDEGSEDTCHTAEPEAASSKAQFPKSLSR